MKKFLIFLVVLFSAAILAGGGFLGYQSYHFKQDNFVLRADKASLENELVISRKNMDALIQEIATTTAARDELAQKYNSEKNRADSVEVQLGATIDTVGVLAKLNASDPELLKKYSKVYFLNENYAPQKLSPIDAKYVDASKKDLLFLDRALPHLQKMMDDAYASSTDIKILSSYRSFRAQSELKLNYRMTYGMGANSFSADQGYSEHQLGTAIDFTTSALDGTLGTAAIEKSPAYKWMTENAHKYGFVLSYPRDNGYYQYEPWHWRYIGVDFATKLHEDKLSFYNLDQRLIDTYLIAFFN